MRKRVRYHDQKEKSSQMFKECIHYSKPAAVAYTYNPSYIRRLRSRGFHSKPAPAKSKTLASKSPEQKKSQVIKHLPKKCKALSSNPRTPA
jgi:hypothetical protein